MFTVTPAAAEEILAAAARSDADAMALRVAARLGIDGSVEYGMGFDEEREEDHPATFGALKVLIAGPSRPLLEGTVLDFVELEPGRFDFIFVPGQAVAATGCSPNASSSGAGSACGSGACGTGRCGA